MIRTNVEVIVGGRFDLPIQTILRGSGAYGSMANGSGDTLTGYVYQGTTPIALFQPTVTWYTGATHSQTGYDQGQVLASATSTQTAAFSGGLYYVLIVWWTPVASPSQPVPIARIRLNAKNPGQL
jgi:hypothetical protein